MRKRKARIEIQRNLKLRDRGGIVAARQHRRDQVSQPFARIRSRARGSRSAVEQNP